MFRQRALGAILGSAIGDALGAPFEFGPSKQYSRAVSTARVRRHGRAHRWRRLQLGAWRVHRRHADGHRPGGIGAGPRRSRSSRPVRSLSRLGESARRRRQPDARRARFEPRLGDGRSRVLQPESEQQRRQRLADAGDADGGALRPRRRGDKHRRGARVLVGHARGSRCGVGHGALPRDDPRRASW